MNPAERLEQLETLADILSRAWYYGGWKAETVAEEQMEQLMEWLGYWPTTEDEILKRPTDAAEFIFRNRKRGTDIGRVCRGLGKQAGGYKWKYKNK